MMDSIDFDALARIGLGPAMRRQLALGVADAAARPMRLVEVQRAHLRLHDGHAEHRARCSPALAADLQQQGEALSVGDWVLARPDGPADAPAAADGSAGWCITCRLLPQGQITRRVTDGRAADGRGGLQRQALVSNVDRVLLVMGLDHDFNLRRLERYLALATLAGVGAVLVLSKADTVDAALRDQRLAQAQALLPPDTPVLALDLRQPAAAADLAPWLLPGHTLALLGSSGAGKSTLANTLVTARHDGRPAADSRGARRLTGAVRDDDSRGRHTTTVRTLLPLAGGACLIDTPGLRALRLDIEDVDQLAQAFGDVARLAPWCRFRDCQHREEPGCAVREAVPEPRLRNFHKLLREARRDTQGVAERRAQLALWKARGRAANQRLRAKRGEAEGGG